MRDIYHLVVTSDPQNIFLAVILNYFPCFIKTCALTDGKEICFLSLWTVDIFFPVVVCLGFFFPLLQDWKLREAGIQQFKRADTRSGEDKIKNSKASE